MNLMNKLERALYRTRIRPFYKYVIYGMCGMLLLGTLLRAVLPMHLFTLSIPMVLRGQIWRLVTFLLMPPGFSPLFALIALMLDYFIGTTLEQRLGAKRFFLLYSFLALSQILSAILTGYGSNAYISMALFMAFSFLYPDYQINIYFVLPVKMKWLGLISLGYLIYAMLIGPLSAKVGALFALAVLYLFFGKEFTDTVSMQIHQYKRRKAFRDQFKR